MLGCFRSALRKTEENEPLHRALRNRDIQVLGHPQSRVHDRHEGLQAHWHKGFSRSLHSKVFHAIALVSSALNQPSQIRLTQSWYFLCYGKKRKPKRSLAVNTQG
jgi:hypothetical protein